MVMKYKRRAWKARKASKGAPRSWIRANKSNSTFSKYALSTYRPHVFTRGEIRTMNVMNGGGITNNQAMVFALAALPSYTDFTNLYDCYRIRKIEVTFTMDCNVAQFPPGNPQACIPTGYFVADFNDGTVLTSVSAALEYDNLKIVRMDKPFKMTIYPKVAAAVWGSAVLTSFGQEDGAGPWIQTASPATNYYGIKFCIDGSVEGGIGTNSMGHLQMTSRYWIECKQAR